MIDYKREHWKLAWEEIRHTPLSQIKGDMYEAIKARAIEIAAAEKANPAPPTSGGLVMVPSDINWVLDSEFKEQVGERIRATNDHPLAPPVIAVYETRYRWRAVVMAVTKTKSPPAHTPKECRHEWFPDPDLGEGSGYLYCRKCDVTRRAPAEPVSVERERLREVIASRPTTKGEIPLFSAKLDEGQPTPADESGVLTPRQLAAVRATKDNAEHDAGDFSDEDEDQANARDLFEGLHKLLKLTAQPRAAAQETRGIATGDTATFADVWTKLQPVERSIISIYFTETQPRVAAQDGDTHAFQNFHRMLCERFGYTHDAIEWRRDQVSLMEHIARLTQPAGDLEDAARLDFLARAGDVFISMIQDAPGDGFIRVSHDLGADGIGETLRAAIDAARRARGEGNNNG